MRSLYYRPEAVSKSALACMALFALSLVLFIELAPLRVSCADQEKMLQASQIAARGFKTIRVQRESLGHRMLKIHDPAGTGMLGPSMSVVTTLPGHLDAKQTSVNPNFAAVVVKYLLELGAKPGDRVAVGCTGSFPALNIAVLAAAETLDLKVVMISSAAASQFGANHPEFMWPDIERLLAEEGVLTSRSLYISRGGFRDDAVGMTEETRTRLENAIARNGIALIEPHPDEDPVAARMRHYAASPQLTDFVAYINVGGGFLSVGGTKGNDQLGAGLVYPPPPVPSDEAAIDSVAHRFLDAGVPLINMVNVLRLAKRHGLPIASSDPIAVGTGAVYQSSGYRRGLALLAIVLIVGQVYFLIRPPVWWTHRARLLPLCQSSSEPKLMV